MKRIRLAFACALVAAAALAFGSPAPAAVQMSTGIRYVMPSGTVADCSDKAKTALSAYLENPVEKTAGGGEWSATGPIGVTGPATAAAVVRCLAAAQRLRGDVYVRRANSRKSVRRRRALPRHRA